MPLTSVDCYWEGDKLRAMDSSSHPPFSVLVGEEAGKIKQMQKNFF